MKRILFFSVVICFFLFSVSSCQTKYDTNSITTHQIKHEYYKQEIALLKYRYKNNPSLQSPFSDLLFELNDRIIEDYLPWPVEGPGEDDPCCDSSREEDCAGENCAPAKGGAVMMIKSFSDGIEINIYDVNKVLLGTSSSEKNKNSFENGSFIYPLTMSVDTLPKRFDIELIEKERTYLVNYLKMD